MQRFADVSGARGTQLFSVNGLDSLSIDQIRNIRTLDDKRQNFLDNNRVCVFDSRIVSFDRVYRWKVRVCSVNEGYHVKKSLISVTHIIV